MYGAVAIKMSNLFRFLYRPLRTPRENIRGQPFDRLKSPCYDGQLPSVANPRDSQDPGHFLVEEIAQSARAARTKCEEKQRKKEIVLHNFPVGDLPSG
jgi:hypothetical protein